MSGVRRWGPGLVAAVLLVGLGDLALRAARDLDPAIPLQAAGWPALPVQGPLGWQVEEPWVSAGVEALAAQLKARGIEGLHDTQRPEALKTAVPLVAVPEGRAPVLLARAAAGDEMDFLVFVPGEGWWVAPLERLAPELATARWYAVEVTP